ncbi:hypothetical protein AZ78_1999 [Lysobacter capsici AZ78]|uniref:Uncharacterized protein n=1 Tax=Lysobacter capsici AZ78 TaxID=1444315 RepID=A0A108U8D7_9GAMM|nr:hypothetical protein AZ78_1999 [Lysobacter capsici AZ78]
MLSAMPPTVRGTAAGRDAPAAVPGAAADYRQTVGESV